MRLNDFAQGLFVTSAVFNDEAIELTWLDDREQTESLMEIHTQVFPITNDPEKVAICSEVQALLQELVNRLIAERRAQMNRREAPERPPSAREAIMAAQREQAPPALPELGEEPTGPNVL